jgi:hypothetical protein
MLTRVNEAANKNRDCNLWSKAGLYRNCSLKAKESIAILVNTCRFTLSANARSGPNPTIKLIQRMRLGQSVAMSTFPLPYNKFSLSHAQLTTRREFKCGSQSYVRSTRLLKIGKTKERLTIDLISARVSLDLSQG